MGGERERAKGSKMLNAVELLTLTLGEPRTKHPRQRIGNGESDYRGKRKTNALPSSPDERTPGLRIPKLPTKEQDSLSNQAHTREKLENLPASIQPSSPQREMKVLTENGLGKRP